MSNCLFISCHLEWLTLCKSGSWSIINHIKLFWVVHDSSSLDLALFQSFTLIGRLGCHFTIINIWGLSLLPHIFCTGWSVEVCVVYAHMNTFLWQFLLTFGIYQTILHSCLWQHSQRIQPWKWLHESERRTDELPSLTRQRTSMWIAYILIYRLDR